MQLSPCHPFHDNNKRKWERKLRNYALSLCHNQSHNFNSTVLWRRVWNRICFGSACWSYMQYDFYWISECVLGSQNHVMLTNVSALCLFSESIFNFLFVGKKWSTQFKRSLDLHNRLWETSIDELTISNIRQRRFRITRLWVSYSDHSKALTKLIFYSQIEAMRTILDDTRYIL